MSAGMRPPRCRPGAIPLAVRRAAEGMRYRPPAESAAGLSLQAGD